MTTYDDDGSRELVPEAWRELDDSLADGPAPASVPPEAKAWLANQRLLHGLLRALHTQDAPAREARIEAILARIDAEPRRDPWRRWVAVAAAALLLACLGTWFVLPARLPTADAAVQRVVSELARDVARRFRVVGSPGDSSGFQIRNEFALVSRPGGRFRVDGRLGPLPFEIHVGSDGQEIWLVGWDGKVRAAPVAERDRLLQTMGNMLDLGYLDVHELVKRLPADCHLEVIGRETDAAGRDLLRIEGKRKADLGQAAVRRVSLLSDEATGMVTRIEADLDMPYGRRHLTIEYLGEEPAGLVEFGRPR
jgi:hypothetical protein